MSDESRYTNDPCRMLDELNRRRIGPHTKMQCKVCHYIYDPDEGCPEWQVPPGTPFNDIPNTWDCPACGCPHSSFILADGEHGEDEIYD